MLSKILTGLGRRIRMHNDVNVENSISFQVLDLVSHNWPISYRQTRHRVAIKLSLYSLWTDLVHYDCLDTDFLGYLRLKVWLMQ